MGGVSTKNVVFVICDMKVRGQRDAHHRAVHGGNSAIKEKANFISIAMVP